MCVSRQLSCYAVKVSEKNSRSRNRRGEGARLRDEIVSAASVLLESLDGQEALSLRAVARAVGIAPQSVYLHFADRRELLTAVYAVRFAELRAALEDSQRDPDPARRLTALCRAYLDYGLTHPGHYRVLFGTAGTPGWEPTPEQLPGLPTFQLLVDGLTACNSADPKVDATCLWAALHGLVTLRQDRPSFPWPEPAVLIDALVRGYAR